MQTPHILIVEDELVTRNTLKSIFEAEGYIVLEANNGDEMHQALTAHTINLVIMDIQLPNVSGLDLIKQIKGDMLLRSIPVLAVTAYAGKGDEERIRDAGAEGYLAKPVSIGPFMAAVKGLVGPS